MMLGPYVWEEYALRDHRGSICGIRDDAPDDMKEAYERDTRERFDQGIAR